MLKTALRRGGRLIAVTALATAFLGSTAGADELQTPPPTQSLNDCVSVVVVRNATVKATLNSSAGSNTAQHQVGSDATVLLCYNLNVTAGLVVSGMTTVEEEADATVNPDGDTCVGAGLVLQGTAGFEGGTAEGHVTVQVNANANADGTGQTVTTGLLEANVDKITVPPGGTVNDPFANARVCVASDGEVSAG